MDAATFDMVNGILAGQGYHNDRESALELLGVGVQNGTLEDVARVIAGRFALQPRVVVEWYGEVLNRQIQGTQAIIEKLKELTKGYDGSH